MCVALRASTGGRLACPCDSELRPLCLINTERFLDTVIDANAHPPLARLYTELLKPTTCSTTCCSISVPPPRLPWWAKTFLFGTLFFRSYARSSTRRRAMANANAERRCCCTASSKPLNIFFMRNATMRTREPQQGLQSGSDISRVLTK